MLYGLSSLLFCAWPLSYLYINNVFSPVLILLCHRQSILLYLMCIFLLECVLAKCILFCMWVLKNLHKWYCAENPIPFPAFVTWRCTCTGYPCCFVFIYSAEPRRCRGLCTVDPHLCPPTFPGRTVQWWPPPPLSSHGSELLCTCL